MSEKELDKLLESIRETTQSIRELREANAELRESQKKTDEQMRETTQRMKEMTKTIEGIGISHGLQADEFFWQSLKHTQTLNNIEVYEKHHNLVLTDENKQVKDELDIVLENGDSLILIEVKFRMKKKYIYEISDKISNLKKYYRSLRGRKVYAGIASFTFPDELSKLAKEYGYIILREADNKLIVETDGIVAF